MRPAIRAERMRKREGGREKKRESKYKRGKTRRDGGVGAVSKEESRSREGPPRRCTWQLPRKINISANRISLLTTAQCLCGCPI